ncbi:MAG TPA: alanine--tRNA ligase [Chlamydiales bacterium]|nr:alanine--tRNA ligase [Chlamydiales bacterium]
MLSQEIRRAFLQYFKSQGHTIVPSSPVVPHDDPTLLFINAGMNQFKDVFLGKSKREYTRAVTTQKCIRVGGKHNDLDNVGHTTRHLTFFEMLGNFSFGDYFKKEAIGYAWDVATHVFGFDPEKIWVSVYKDDDEAFALWEKHVPAKRLVRFGEKENFWAMGDTGPCGPCSELLYDRGEKYGNAKSPAEDLSGERYLEFWNLVFMQFERNGAGKMEPLPKKSIDTGSGLERVVSLKMGVETVFQTDILRDLIAQVEEISGKRYEPENHSLAPAFHVIADHIRSLSFAIADGVQPSNTDRGYVLRKILRRAVRYGRMLGLQRPFLAEVLPRLVRSMGEDFPELKAAKSRISEILTLEEEAFLRTLQRGGQLLGQVIERSHTSGEKISGEDAFKLKDTYGFPLEEIVLIAKDENLSVDLPRFEVLEEEAKEKSRKAHKTAAQQFGQNFFSDFTRTHKPCQFEGYQKTKTESMIWAMVVDGKFVDEIEEGQEGLIILDKTPFYPEMGGQVGDTGEMAHGGNLFQVYDCTAPFPGVIAHLGKMAAGKLRKNEKVHAAIDAERRKEIQNNHTATHLLHWALQQILGPHIKQAGSLVDEKRLRFDFNHHKAMTPAELRQIEDLVNEKIRTDIPVQTYELSYDEAQKRSDIKQFFGEKYGEKVRVVDADFSKELCGGTHTTRLGTIGLFKIAKESSIAAGVRRIEAVTGRHAEIMVQQEEDLLHSLAAQLKAPLQSLPEKFQALIDENKLLLQELKSYRKAHLKQLLTKCLSHKEKAGSIALIAIEVPITAEELNEFANELMDQLKSGVVALGAKVGERCQLLVSVSPDLVQKNVSAGALIKEVAPLIQGGGGGKQNLAQAGGKDPSGLPKALEKIRFILKEFNVK